jgi:glycosyltransferase involved in cell wall biosynthesis
MEKTVPVSVIVPTFNRASLLQRALRSVLAQTARPREIIVVDDGSTDGTGDVVQNLQTQYPQIRYYYQTNQGVSKARNTGISLAKAAWIAFLDSDDQWLKNKLALQMEQLHANPGYWLCHTEEIWIRRGKRVNPMNKHKKYAGNIYDKCLPLCPISPSSVVLHRDLLQTVGLFDESLPACEDYDLWLRICSRYPVLFIETPLIVKYGGHEDQLSRRYWGMDRFRIQALLKMLEMGGLSQLDYQLTLGMLIQKCTIYAQGAAKRGKQAEARYYQNIIDGVAEKTPAPA